LTGAGDFKEKLMQSIDNWQEQFVYQEKSKDE
jgi:hypothetical protein